MNLRKNTFMGFVSKNLYLIIIIAVMILAAFGYAIVTSDELSIDEELTLQQSSDEHILNWLTYGRYGISLVSMTLMPIFDAVPYFNYFIAVVMLGINAALLCYFASVFLKNIKVPKLAYVFLAVACLAYPAHVDFLSFNSINISVGIGFLCTTVSSYLISSWIYYKKNLICAICGLVLLTFVISIYQSFVGVYFTLAASFSIFYFLDMTMLGKKEKFKNVVLIVVKYFVALGTAFVAFYVLDYVLKAITGIAGNSYVGGMFQMNSVRQMLFNLYYNMNRVIIEGYGANDSTITYIVGLFLCLQIVFIFYKNNVNKLLNIILALALIFAPFALGISFPGVMTRALGGVPTLVGMCGFISIILLNMYVEKLNEKQVILKRFLHNVAIISVVLISINYVYLINLNYYADHIRYIRTENLANMIASDIVHYTEEFEVEKPVVIIGEREILSQDNISETLTMGCQFNYDITPLRTIFFMRYLGYDFKVPNAEQIEEAQKLAEDMQVWPKQDSIKEYDELVVVKISELE